MSNINIIIIIIIIIIINPHKSFACRQLNATSHKSLEIPGSVLYRKAKNPLEPKICVNKGF